MVTSREGKFIQGTQVGIGKHASEGYKLYLSLWIGTSCAGGYWIHASIENPTLRLNHSPPCHTEWQHACGPSQKSPSMEPPRVQSNGEWTLNDRPEAYSHHRKVAALTKPQTQPSSKSWGVAPNVRRGKKPFLIHHKCIAQGNSYPDRYSVTHPKTDPANSWRTKPWTASIRDFTLWFQAVCWVQIWVSKSVVVPLPSPGLRSPELF